MAAYALKYYGGKHRFAQWLIEHAPPAKQITRVADHCTGSAAAITAFVRHYKTSLMTYSANDIDPAVVNMLHCIKDHCKEMQDILRTLKYSLETFKHCVNLSDIDSDIAASPLASACTEYTLLRMSRNGDRKTFSKCTRIRRGMNEGDSKWLSGIDALEVYSHYLQPVCITMRDMHRSIQQTDCGNTFHYIDPPYMHIARGSSKDYRHELAANTEDDIAAHTKIYETVSQCSGTVMVSGYPTELYAELYKDWRQEVNVTTSSASKGAKKKRRVECIWMNY